jgi:hypothetical protein
MFFVLIGLAMLKQGSYWVLLEKVQQKHTFS